MNIVVDGYNICYKTTGTGDKTVVILQGWGTDLGVYDSVAGVIDGSRYRVIQFDFPGFGGSDEPKEPWDVDGFADFFCRFMEVMQVKQATLIGHSYGGRVIIKLAARESIPFEITNIILIDSAGVLPVRTTAQKWKIRKYKILKKFLNMKLIYAMFPEVIDDWRSRQGSADYRNATPMMRQCMVKAVNEDLTELLPKIPSGSAADLGRSGIRQLLSGMHILWKRRYPTAVCSGSREPVIFLSLRNRHSSGELWRHICNDHTCADSGRACCSGIFLYHAV